MKIIRVANKGLIQQVMQLLKDPQVLIKALEQEKAQQELATAGFKGKLIAGVLAMFLAIPISQVYQNPSQAVSQAQDRLNTMGLGGTQIEQVDQTPAGQYSSQGLSFDGVSLEKAEQMNKDIYGFEKSLGK
jgi:hypothetical protein